jgi:DNA repair exonuclease SbcCD ATPase subunit
MELACENLVAERDQLRADLEREEAANEEWEALARKDAAELHQLRGEVERLRKELGTIADMGAVELEAMATRALNALGKEREAISLKCPDCGRPYEGPPTSTCWCRPTGKERGA